MKKSELRKEIKNRKRQFTSQQLSELSFAVIMRLLAHQRLKDARTVMLYYSLPDEVYTHTLVDALLASGYCCRASRAKALWNCACTQVRKVSNKVLTTSWNPLARYSQTMRR